MTATDHKAFSHAALERVRAAALVLVAALAMAASTEARSESESSAPSAPPTAAALGEAAVSELAEQLGQATLKLEVLEELVGGLATRPKKERASYLRVARAEWSTLDRELSLARGALERAAGTGPSASGASNVARELTGDLGKLRARLARLKTLLGLGAPAKPAKLAPPRPTTTEAPAP
ncbi:MAG: hypothetical protein HYY25_02795 [Candidatus Wallbacteria bacterium]|nr:hypothetical protein [Candidatus Wallbacteria bacterium]